MPLFLTIPVDVDAMADSIRLGFSQLNAGKIFGAVAVAAICLALMKLLLAVLDRALGRSKLDEPLQKLLRGLFKGGLWFITAIIVLECLGIKVTSLVAVLSVVGLAFSLALQNFLSNVAGGMQLLASHPFAVGDYVDAGGCSGTVVEIGMFYTKLATPDNKLVQLPNSAIVSANIINFSAQPHRRVELTVSASYDAPTDQVIALLAKMAADHPLVLDDPEPAVHVNGYGDNAIDYIMRVWCANTDYWTVYFELMDGLKPLFDRAGVEMTYPHLNVHMVD
ncbi:MAG: mechanosensitive ion channel family protein [Oscillospiraceae bacterium]|jgi:small conductance mechanosensitive channel|nr:mechanosensitive ion channel family protein [Oscillospiraceae bacterium]